MYDDSEWKNAMEIPLEGYVCKDVVNGDEYQDYNLIAQYGQTVKAIKTLTAQSVEEVRPGIFVYDMGQNMVGVPRSCSFRTFCIKPCKYSKEGEYW